MSIQEQPRRRGHARDLRIRNSFAADFRARRSYDLGGLRLRVDIQMEMAPSLDQADAAAEVLSQDILRWLEVWLARRLSYLPDARDIESKGDGEQLELHLHGKLLAVLNVSVERVMG